MLVLLLVLVEGSKVHAFSDVELAKHVILLVEGRTSEIAEHVIGDCLYPWLFLLMSKHVVLRGTEVSLLKHLLLFWLLRIVLLCLLSLVGIIILLFGLLEFGTAGIRVRFLFLAKILLRKGNRVVVERRFLVSSTVFDFIVGDAEEVSELLRAFLLHLLLGGFLIEGDVEVPHEGFDFRALTGREVPSTASETLSRSIGREGLLLIGHGTHAAHIAEPSHHWVHVR